MPLPKRHLRSQRRTPTHEGMPNTAGRAAVPAVPAGPHTLCCVHSNTFFAGSAGGGGGGGGGHKGWCGHHMVTVQIHYTQVYGQVGYDSVQRQSGQVTRTMCLPFSPVGVQCRLSKDGMLLFRGAAGAAVQEGNGRGGQAGGRGAQEESREEGGGGGGSKMLYRLSAQDMHLVDRVLLQMDSITVCPLGSESAVDERLAPRRLTRPYAVNLCASCACIEGHGRAELTEGCKRLGIAKVERMNINRGTTISSVLCKAVLSATGSPQDSIRIVGATNLTRCVKFLSGLCNIDVASPPQVHMAIFKACLPHSTRMGKNPTLHFMLHKYISDSCMTYTCDTIDMDHVMLDIVVHDCMGLASFLESKAHTNEGHYARALGEVDAQSMEALRNTSFKVKVTHFGKVRLEFTWREATAGRLRWTRKNRVVVHAMIDMAMRFLEMCT